MISSLNIEERLREKGFRKTQVRTKLIELLAKGGKPLSVPDLLLSIPVNKTTLYRELEFLKRQGIIAEVRFNERQTRYELAGDHHHHLVCTSCNRVEDVELERELDEEERKIESATNFRIDRHALEFFGKCANCHA